MDLRPLRHAVMLAHHLHFRKAADALGLTQPALSKSIQLTEERYGGRLFDRSKRAVSLTSMGRVFVEQAERLLTEASEFEHRMARTAGGVEGKVTFGVSPSTSRLCLHPLLCELAADRPDIRVDVAVRKASALVRMLLDEEIEFLICSKNLMPASANVSFKSFGFDAPIFVVRPGHPLVEAGSSADIDAFPIIAPGPLAGRADDLYVALTEFFRHRPLMTIESAEALARFTENSDAIWMSSTFSAARELESGTLVALERQQTQDHPIEVGLFSLRHKTTSPAAADVAQRLRRIIASSGTGLATRAPTAEP